MASDILSKYTTVEDVKVHYLTAGQEGEVILFIHGWPTSSLLWRNIMKSLASDYQVIALDLPGYGKSEKRLQDSYSFRYYSRIIQGFLDNLKINKLTFGLHDAGGPIGLYWTIHNMDRVNKLILFNTLVYPEFSYAVKLFAMATRLPGIKTWMSSPTGIKKAMQFGVYQKHKLTTEAIQQYQSAFQNKNDRNVLCKAVQRLSIKGFLEIEQRLGNFGGAVQIIYGKKDRILPNVAKTMQKVKEDLPQSRMMALENCGHFLQEEEPEQISHFVHQFMKTT